MMGSNTQDIQALDETLLGSVLPRRPRGISTPPRAISTPAQSLFRAPTAQEISRAPNTLCAAPRAV
jgi:hypothetical protein